MHALVCAGLGGPEQLRWRELPDPEPAADEVVIEVDAAGVNFPDGLMVAGRYQTKPPLPFVPGSEVAGRILSVGSVVDGLEPGQRVAAFCGIGGYAERVAVAASQVYPHPDGVEPTRAAAMPVAYGTSYHALVDLAGVSRDETVLVLGAAGGVGLTAVEIAHALGARVIAAASTREKLDLCAAHGADELVDYRHEDLAARLETLTDRAGVDVVVDPVGGQPARDAVRRLAWRGRHLSIGYASGEIPEVPMNRLLLNEGILRGVLWGAWARREPQRNAANIAQLFAWCEQGRLRPHLGGRYPLERGAEALAVVMGRGALGKVVLERTERSHR